MDVQHDRDGVVLIVDDDQSIRETVQEALEQEHQPAAIAGNGQEALEWLHDHPPPRLILLDLMMPVMDGWQVIDKLRDDDHLAGVPIVVITAFGRELGSAARFPTLRKPFDLRDLLDVIDRYGGAAES